jgi:hypothetical protein
MTVLIAIADFAISRAGIALMASIFGGILFTFFWSDFSHLVLRTTYPEHFTGADRSRWIGVMLGIVDRVLLTMLTLWLPQALGPIAAAIIGVKAVLGWGDLQKDSNRAARTRYSVSHK